jgi:hypothetical protein
MLLAEFDYSFQITPSFPLLNPTNPHRGYWYLKKYGLPFMYRGFPLSTPLSSAQLPNSGYRIVRTRRS